MQKILKPAPVAITLTLLCATLSAFADDKPVATDVCASLENARVVQKNQKIAQIACAEHTLWGSPFINGDGKIVSIGPMEAEKDALTDGSPAWLRVERYWQDGAGIAGLYHTDHFPTDETEAVKDAFIRTHIIDTPWSGTFISYVMRQAGLNADEFAFEDGHIRNIKPAFSSENSAYAFSAKNPFNTKLEVGDLLCSAREGEHVFGAVNFQLWLKEHSQDNTSLKMHCDIVVGKSGQNAFLIGGNVVQTVMMRQLKLTTQGLLSPQHSLPENSTTEVSWLASLFGAVKKGEKHTLKCEPLSDVNCDMNRKDWVVLLKYKKP